MDLDTIFQFRVPTFLCPENSAQTLGFLSPGTSDGWNLDEHVCVRQVERVVGNFWDEDGFHCFVLLEVVQDFKPFLLWSWSTQIWSAMSSHVSACWIYWKSFVNTQIYIHTLLELVNNISIHVQCHFKQCNLQLDNFLFDRFHLIYFWSVMSWWTHYWH